MSQASACSLSAPKVRVWSSPARSSRGSASPRSSCAAALRPKRPWMRATRRERLAHDQRRLARRRALGARRAPAHVAAPAAGERLLLVAEVAQDRVVAAAAALGPAHQLEEQAPLVLDDRGVGRGAVVASLEQRAGAAGGRAGDDSSRPSASRAVAARRARPPGSRPRSSPGGAEVDDRAHVGAVDAHAERVGGDDDLELPARTRAAPRSRARRVEPRVVHARRASRAAASRAPPPPRRAARRRVHDGGAAAARPGAPSASRERPRRPRRSRSRAAVAPRAREREIRAARSRARSAACRRAGRAARGSRRARPASRWRCRRARARRAAPRAGLPICRYSGRKSWPHSLMQCASSIATSGHASSREQRAEAGEREPLGRDVDERVARRARRAPCAARSRSRVERGGQVRRRERRARRAPATWSCISATSGETTSVVPGSSAAGSW